MLSLPPLLPTTNQFSRGRFRGGSRPPATALKDRTSSDVIGRAVVAFRTLRQLSHDGPLNHGRKSWTESIASMMLGTLVTLPLALVTRRSPRHQDRATGRRGTYPRLARLAAAEVRSHASIARSA